MRKVRRRRKIASVAAIDLKPSQNFFASNFAPPPSRAAATTFLGAAFAPRFLLAIRGISPETGGKTRGARLAARPSGPTGPRDYLRFLETSLVMSNIETWPLPPKTTLSLSSALIMRRFFLSCRLCFLMYAQSFLVSSVRGSGDAPTTAASFSFGVTGFMNAAFGLRLVAFFAAFFAGFFAAFLAGAFFAAFFFLAAIR